MSIMSTGSVALERRVPTGIAALIAAEREAAGEYLAASVDHRTVLTMFGTSSPEYAASSAREDAAMGAVVRARVAVDIALAGVTA